MNPVFYFTKEVSVITPAFNSSDTIARAIISVAEQAYQVYEHIIIDDGSQDDTVEMVEFLSKEYTHIKLVKQSNQGAGAARNTGIKLAKGEFVAFLDADDYWAPDKLNKQISFMVSMGVDFSYGDYFEYDLARGKITRAYIAPDKVGYKDLLKGCPIGCLTVVYNQSNLGKLYMPNIRRGQDWALWLMITRSGVAAYKYSGVSAFYTVSPSSLSKNKLKKLIDVFYIYRQQENMGFFRSLYYLFRHVMFVACFKNKGFKPQ